MNQLGVDAYYECNPPPRVALILRLSRHNSRLLRSKEVIIQGEYWVSIRLPVY